MNEDVLVFLETDKAASSERQKLEAGATQCAGPRLFVVAETAVAASAGTHVIRTADDLQANSHLMNDQEMLFVRAWITGRNKDGREGDSLPWDAPGFESP